MELTCRDCIHYDVCDYHITEMTTMTIAECLHEFKNKADFAEVVRCKNCVYYQQNPWNKEEELLCQCWADWLPTEPTDFCSCGERKADD